MKSCFSWPESCRLWPYVPRNDISEHRVDSMLELGGTLTGYRYIDSVDVNFWIIPQEGLHESSVYRHGTAKASQEA